MTKKAFFVTGPEGSGTRMMTRALVLAGCHEDQTRWDFGNDLNFDNAPDLITVHRSIPHGQAWPDLRKLSNCMRKSSYEVFPIVMIRDVNATIKSQVGRQYTGSEKEGWKKVRWALETAINQLPYFIPVTYEAFCFSPGFRKWLFVNIFELPESPIDIWYANEKYYGDGHDN